jgi:hypothetical protein
MKVGYQARDLGKEIERVDAEYTRDDKQFDHIDPTLAALVFRNKALRLRQLCGEFLLRKICPSPGSAQARTDDPVMLGCDPQRGCPRSTPSYGRGSILFGPTRADLMRAI